jgi:hypothetical protein
MPLELPDDQYWRAAVGYVELGMFQEANDQLENIGPFNRAAPEDSSPRSVFRLVPTRNPKIDLGGD